MNLVSSTEFTQKLNDYKGLTVVDFYADWCAPCRALTPILEQLSDELDEVQFLKLNIDESRDIAQKYGISSIPTLIFFKNSEPVQTLNGLRSAEDLKEEISKYA